MPLPTNLNTNEIKNAAGTEVEFLSAPQRGDGSTKVYSKSGAQPNLRELVSVSHTETGVGLKRLRRSVAQASKEFLSESDNVTPARIRLYKVAEVPVGHLTSMTKVKEVAAWMISGEASDGTSTTIKYDCTGTLTDALVNGTL